MLAAQADLGQRHDLLHVAVELRRHPAVGADEHAVIQRAPPAEPQHLGARARGQPGGRRVVRVEHRAVGRRLVEEDPRLGRDVGGEVAVAVEVIGRHVEDRRHPRLERLDRLELERRHLGHHEAVARELADFQVFGPAIPVAAFRPRASLMADD